MNEAMTMFTKDLGFTVAFLIGAMLINMTLGEKPLYWYLFLVLLSMLVLNSSKLAQYVRRLN